MRERPNLVRRLLKRVACGAVVAAVYADYLFRRPEGGYWNHVYTWIRENSSSKSPHLCLAVWLLTNATLDRRPDRVLAAYLELSKRIPDDRLPRGKLQAVIESAVWLRNRSTFAKTMAVASSKAEMSPVLLDVLQHLGNWRFEGQLPSWMAIAPNVGDAEFFLPGLSHYFLAFLADNSGYTKAALEHYRLALASLPVASQEYLYAQSRYTALSQLAVC